MRIVECHLSRCNRELRNSRHKFIAIAVSAVHVLRQIEVFDTRYDGTCSVIFIGRAEFFDSGLAANKRVFEPLFADAIRCYDAETRDHNPTSFYQTAAPANLLSGECSGVANVGRNTIR